MSNDQTLRVHSESQSKLKCMRMGWTHVQQVCMVWTHILAGMSFVRGIFWIIVSSLVLAFLSFCVDSIRWFCSFYNYGIRNCSHVLVFVDLSLWLPGLGFLWLRVAFDLYLLYCCLLSLASGDLMLLCCGPLTCKALCISIANDLKKIRLL